jgi:hypothetical protein
MKVHHSPYHWISVALVLIALLLMLEEAHGQSTGSAAMFEGRPAMAGAQGGLGAQAGPPQGGIGVQGSDAAQRSVVPRPPAPPPVTGMPQGARDTAGLDSAAARAELASRQDVRPARDPGIAQDQRSAVKKAKRAVKRNSSRRHGVSPIDSTSGAAAR